MCLSLCLFFSIVYLSTGDRQNGGNIQYNNPYSCFLLIYLLKNVSVLKKFKDIEGVVKMVEVDGEELVKKFAEEMEEMLGRKMKSVKVIMAHI